MNDIPKPLHPPEAYRMREELEQSVIQFGLENKRLFLIHISPKEKPGKRFRDYQQKIPKFFFNLFDSSRIKTKIKAMVWFILSEPVRLRTKIDSFDTFNKLWT